MARPIRFHLVRWLPLVGAALVGYLAFPPPAVVVTALPQVGQVADRTVVAPFSFETRKSSEEIASEGESRALSVRPVYRYSPTAYDSALGAARSFFAELERAEQQGPDLLRAVAAARASLGPIGDRVSHGWRRSDDGSRRSSPTSWPRRSRAGWPTPACCGASPPGS